MSAFRAIVFAAALGGLSAGLAATAIGALGTGPLIARAETYEKAEGSAPAAPAAQAPARDHVHAPGTPAHDHGPAWEPADGLERGAYTALFNVVNWFGFALLVAGALVLFRRPATWREGLLWGFAGFAVFVLAPTAGLPPELPGIPAAPLGARQLWWAAAAGSAALGLGLVALTRSAWLAALGIAIVAVPHVVGAPQLAQVETDVPIALSQRFADLVVVSAFLTWALVGAVTGHGLGRFAARESVAEAGLPRPAA
jgi:cobalt transporter subunit CbtA